MKNKFFMLFVAATVLSELSCHSVQITNFYQWGKDTLIYPFSIVELNNTSVVEFTRTIKDSSIGTYYIDDKNGIIVVDFDNDEIPNTINILLNDVKNNPIPINYRPHHYFSKSIKFRNFKISKRRKVNFSKIMMTKPDDNPNYLSLFNYCAKKDSNRAGLISIEYDNHFEIDSALISNSSKKYIEQLSLKANYYVLTYWFTSCKPCIKELTEICDMTLASPDVAFITATFEDSARANPVLDRICSGNKFNKIYDIKNQGVGFYPTLLIFDKNLHNVYFQQGSVASIRDSILTYISRK